MDKTITIQVCDTPQCGSTNIVVCTKCKKLCCAAHRLEGAANTAKGVRVQVFVCLACQGPLALSVG